MIIPPLNPVLAACLDLGREAARMGRARVPASAVSGLPGPLHSRVEDISEGVPQQIPSQHK